jgi:membrane protease YdiL (CAAX protease family)
MLDPVIHVSWSAGLSFLVDLSAVAFLVSWAFSDLRPIKRVFYIPILAVTTGAVTVKFLVWSQSGTSFWTNRWGYGLIGAAVASALLSALLNRQRIPNAKPHPITAQSLGWDGVVYGAAEGLLLSVLPVVVTWQMLSSNGWTTGWRTVAAGALSIVASMLVVVVHHLGYPEFRGPKMAQALLGCGILSIAYLLTGSVIAPILAHAVLHTVAVRNGMELPPHEDEHRPMGANDVPVTL